MLKEFDFSEQFRRANEAMQDIFNERHKDFIEMFPLQAHIHDRVAQHIALGPAREVASMIRWRLQATRRGYIEYPYNLTPDMKLRKEFL